MTTIAATHASQAPATPEESLDSTAAQGVAARAQSLLDAHRQAIWQRTDRLFAGLLVFEWVGGVIWALCRAPRTWEGSVSYIHPHVWQALILGALIAMLPVFLALRFPGRLLTRHVVAVSQMLSSALLIHISGGARRNPLPNLRIARVSGILSRLACADYGLRRHGGGSSAA